MAESIIKKDITYNNSINHFYMARMDNIVFACTDSWIDSRNLIIPSEYRPTKNIRIITQQLSADGSVDAIGRTTFNSNGTVTCEKYPYFSGSCIWVI
jgi:hypothetical protein